MLEDGSISYQELGHPLMDWILLKAICGMRNEEERIGYEAEIPSLLKKSCHK
jgi:hypothetical protein